MRLSDARFEEEEAQFHPKYVELYGPTNRYGMLRLV
jgi:hypothetical protein